MAKVPLVRTTDAGLYCEAGDFFVDPWAPVNRALITHSHSDHARWGSDSYLVAKPGLRLAQTRLGSSSSIEAVDYGEKVRCGDVEVSFHPAGHILGSAQIRLEHRGQVWVISGDYKVEPDPTCEQFEPVQCHVFISEATFALPIYRWQPSHEVFSDINQWWATNQEKGKASVLFCYALGKAQRILHGIDSSIGPIFSHGAVEKLCQDYRDSGVDLAKTVLAGLAPRETKWSTALILAPPSANGTPWLRRFGSLSTAFASGWMAIRGTRRRRAVDRGIVLSDHADWPGLLWAIEQSGAETIYVTHGYVPQMVRYLRERGVNAHGLTTRFEGELDEAMDAGSDREEDGE